MCLVDSRWPKAGNRLNIKNKETIMKEAGRIVQNWNGKDDCVSRSRLGMSEQALMQGIILGVWVWVSGLFWLSVRRMSVESR